jgi:DNA processing protein
VIDDTHRAWAYLSRVAEPPCPELSAVVAQVGPMEAAQRIGSGMVDERLARPPMPDVTSIVPQRLALLGGMGGPPVSPTHVTPLVRISSLTSKSSVKPM